MLFLVCSIVACSSDDDEDISGVMSTQAGYLYPNSNKRIKRVGNVNFEYYGSGSIKSVSNDKSAHYFSEDGKTITTYSGSVTTNYNTEFRFTNAGYISRLNSNYSNDQHSNTVTRSFTYDRDGHLTSGSAILEERDYDGHVSRGSETLSLTWSNGLLVKVDRTQEMEDLEYGNSSARIVWKFDYDDAPQNIYAQIPPIMVSMFLGIEAYLGLLGRGPAMFPTSMTVERYDGSGNKKDNYTVPCYHTLNDDGSLNGGISSDGYINYEYEIIEH